MMTVSPSDFLPTGQLRLGPKRAGGGGEANSRDQPSGSLPGRGGGQSLAFDFLLKYPTTDWRFYFLPPLATLPSASRPPGSRSLCAVPFPYHRLPVRFCFFLLRFLSRYPLRVTAFRFCFRPKGVFCLSLFRLFFFHSASVPSYLVSFFLLFFCFLISQWLVHVELLPSFPSSASRARLTFVRGDAAIAGTCSLSFATVHTHAHTHVIERLDRA